MIFHGLLIPLVFVLHARSCWDGLDLVGVRKKTSNDLRIQELEQAGGVAGHTCHTVIPSYARTG